MRFAEVKKNFGFGCMRLPMQGKEVVLAQFSQMVDEYLAAEFSYFDTARVYLGGKSEAAIRECIAKRYPRESFLLADKLSNALFETEEEARPLFQKQLESCGVEYFDFYLMHAQGKASECIGCGKCEAACPQHLSIRQYLKDAAKEFEKK